MIRALGSWHADVQRSSPRLRSFRGLPLPAARHGTSRMTSVQLTFASTLVDEWARVGIRHAVIAPGSRSTPLVIALAREGAITKHVRLDERSAGFFALGAAIETGMPSVVVVTSGTAAAELHPSVLEAHHAGIPMIVCTADRPPELHGVGAPQTVEQDGLFAGAVRWSANPGVPDAGVSGTWRSLAARAVLEALGGPAGPGPVHLNLAFRDPLIPPGAACGDARGRSEGRSGGLPWHVTELGTGVGAAGAGVAAEVATAPAGAGVGAGLGIDFGVERGVIIAGGRSADPSALVALADSLGWPLLADPRSGARVCGHNVIAAADALLRSEAFACAHEPEVVLRFGDPWASRALNEWIAGLGAKQVKQYLVDPFWRWQDPARSASVVIRADPDRVCSIVMSGAASRGSVAGTGVSSEWLDSWKAAEAAAQEVMTRVLEDRGDQDELSGPAVARQLVRELGSDHYLVVASSMAIRNVEWFGPSVVEPPRVVSNRGVNGIDGVMSTALGVSASAGRRRPVVGLLGDLAFLHDCSALAGVDPAGAGDGRTTIVVVDNAGGGIFSFLPQAKALQHSELQRFFVTPPEVDVRAVAKAFGARVMTPTSRVELSEALADGCTGGAGRGASRGGLSVVVVKVPYEREVEIHEEIMSRVAGSLAVER